MSTLSQKIDFAVILTAKNANPNGDPLCDNRPRTNYDGIGEISDVCIKRKIRNRLQDAGKTIFVQSDDYKKDSYTSLKARFEKELSGDDRSSKDKTQKAACEKWIDVRAFGQVFPFKDKADKKGKQGKENTTSDQDAETGEKDKSVSVGVRGPVSIQAAFSVGTVNVTDIQITKSVNLKDEKEGGRGSDTMGMKHRVDFGVYVFYGSMNPQLAEKTGFSDDDAEAIKKALLNLFENDASSARPEGSMEVKKLYWWKHNSKSGQYSSAKVHHSLKVTPKVDEPKSFDDVEIIDLYKLDGLVPEILEGR